MIEVLALAGAITKIAGGISSAVQAGKDMNSIMPHFGKLAKLEADIALHTAELKIKEQAQADKVSNEDMKNVLNAVDKLAKVSA